MKLKRVWARLSLVVIAGVTVSCSPEPMSVSQACRAWLDTEHNSPKTSQRVQAEYTIDYYQDFSMRTDGRLQTAFNGMAKVNQAMLDSRDDDLSDSDLDVLIDSYQELVRICGHPFDDARK